MFLVAFYSMFFGIKFKNSGVSIFEVLLLGKNLYTSVIQALNNFVSYAEYQVCVKRICYNSKEIEYGADQKEVCSICQDFMSKSIQLSKCKHEFHQYCIIQYICQGGAKCPMCRQEIELKLPADDN